MFLFLAISNKYQRLPSNIQQLSEVPERSEEIWVRRCNPGPNNRVLYAPSDSEDEGALATEELP